MQSGSAREKKRDWEDCADALSLLLSSPLPFHVHKTHTLTHTCKYARRRSTPTCCLSCAQLATLSGALRGRAWRQESEEIEVEEDGEEDVYDEGRKKIENLKEWIPC